MGLEFGEGHLDRIEVRAVSWQVTYGGSSGFNQVPDGGDFVGGEVIKDDDVSGVKLRTQDMLKVSREHLGIDRPLDKERGGHAIMAQSRQKSGALPVTVRFSRLTSLAYRRTPVTSGHLGVDASLINEDQPPHVPERLLSPPVAASQDQIRPVLLGGARRFF